MMERALKERIIGAAVLVIFAVLIVPVFLDGPPADGELITERVLLPGQEGQETQTVVLERDRTDPVPTASVPVPTRQQTATPEPASEEPKPAATRTQEPEKAPEKIPEKTPEKAPEKTPERAAPKPAVTQPAVSSTGMWAVQLGSFSNKDNAEKLAADLRKQGYAAFLSQLATDKGPLHRVRIGPQKDRASAEAMAGRLAKVGHKGQVVPHP
jgi:DedD protein